LKRGNPPPIRPVVSTGLVLKSQPESDWQRRVEMAREFPQTISSKQVYERLGLDSKKQGGKKVASRVMKAAGFVAKRGRRGAIWEKATKADSAGSQEAGHTLPSPLISTSYR